MEKDDEIKGQGNSYTTQFRAYDPRLGKWLSLDPLMAKYPHQSAYAGFNNSPIFYADPTGLEGDPPDKDKTKPKTHTVKKGDTYSKVAKAYKVSVDDLRKWNKWKDTEIPVGEEMVVSNPNAINEKQEVEYKSDVNLKVVSDSAKIDEADPSQIDFGEASRTPMSKEDFQMTKDICVTMVNWAFFAYGTGNKLPKSRGLKLPKGRYKPVLRLKYESEVKALKKIGEGLLKNGKSEEFVAKTLHRMRRLIGMKYKGMSSPRALERIYQRNIEIYGDKYGLSIEQLIERGKSWRQIIESASRPGGKDLIFGIRF